MKKFKIGDKVRIIGNHSDPHKFEIGEIVTIKTLHNNRYSCTNQKESWMVNIDCVAKIEDTITQEPKVGDWVKCTGHSDYWSTKFVIGQAYKVRAIIQNSYSVITSDGVALWVTNQDFILCNDELQDDSGWKIGDKLQYIREGTYEMGLNDCTVGMIYTIVKINRTLGYTVIIDDVEDTVVLSPEELKRFKKIINNQTTINYVKDNSNNSFELPSSSPAISARQIARGGIVSSSDLEIWI